MQGLGNIRFTLNNKVYDIERIKRKKIKGELMAKPPIGIWYSFGNNWVDGTGGEMGYKNTENLYTIAINMRNDCISIQKLIQHMNNNESSMIYTGKILRITSRTEAQLFSNFFINRSEYWNNINYTLLSTYVRGLEVDNRNSSFNINSYFTDWDVPSGVIWNFEKDSELHLINNIDRQLEYLIQLYDPKFLSSLSINTLNLYNNSGNPYKWTGSHEKKYQIKTASSPKASSPKASSPKASSPRKTSPKASSPKASSPRKTSPK